MSPTTRIIRDTSDERGRRVVIYSAPQTMLRAVATVARRRCVAEPVVRGATSLGWRGCSSDAASALVEISAEEYSRVASLTIDCLQEVYEDFADDAPQHQMDVECTVCPD